MQSLVIHFLFFFLLLNQRILYAEAQSCCEQLRQISFSSSLPVLILRTISGRIKDEPKVPARFCTCASSGNFDGSIGIEIRGSSSARDFSKKSYSLETRDSQGKALDVPLIGFPRDNDWVLYGPELDKSLGLRNVLTYQLAQALHGFSPKTTFVEVFVVENGETLAMKHYNGLYVFMEKIKRDKHRVNISKRAKDDITGGYIVKHDNNNIDEGDRHFRLRWSGMDMIMVYPKKKVVTNQEMNYLKSYLDQFEAALLSYQGTDRSYTNYIDFNSFVDYFLITELTKNPDGYRGSTYLHKEKRGRVSMGPVWDYNEAYGLCCGYPIEGYLNNGVSYGTSGGSAISPNGWRFNICEQPERCQVDPLDGVSRWYRILWKDPVFYQAVQQRWFTLRSGPFSDESVKSIIQRAKSQIGLVAWRNNARWSSVLGFHDANPTLNEIATLQRWTLQRLQWMDQTLALENTPQTVSSQTSPLLLRFRKTTTS